MTKEKLPQLTEAQVRKLASDQSFERGKGYYRDGAVLEPVRQGMELRAECAGSEYEPYQISVTLDKDGIAETSCSCPYDWGGICKHLVALLLTYVHRPQAFHAVAPLDAMLAARSKEELIALIGEMVKQEPKLVSLLELSAAARQAQEGKPIDAAAYRRQARQALRHDSPRAVEKELKALRDAAARLTKAGDWLNAGAVYHALLDETIRHYDDMMMSMDEDGDIAIIADEFAVGLGQCLEKSKADGKTRQAWLEALLKAYLTDIELGGIDLASSAYDAVLDQASDEEWERIEKQVRAVAAGSREWSRESLVEFLAAGRKRHGRADDATALIREMGTPEQQALLLAEEGNTVEAVRLMKKILTAKPGLVTEFADALVEAGANEAAVKLVTERVRPGDWQSLPWLAEYYRQHGSPQAALEWQQKHFLNQPSVEAFKALREVSRKTGNWQQTRADALAALERQKKIDALIEIALHENDVAQALKLLPRLSGRGWRDYKLEVARAAEKDHPQEAIRIYREAVERAINERQRSSYQQAAQYLKRVKELSQRRNAQADWNAYIQSLRQQYANLPALQDELRKARL